MPVTLIDQRLSSKEKEQVAYCLGLSTTEFQYQECRKNELLYSSTSVPDPTAARIILQHGERQQVLPMENSAKSLLANLLPYPLSLIENTFGDGPRQVEVAPHWFRQELLSLHEAFWALEQLCRQVEFSCLFFQRDETSFCVLLHYVRTRLMGAQVEVPANALSEKFLKKELNSDVLRAFFGSQAGFWSLANPLEQGVGAAARHVLKQVENPESRVLYRLNPLTGVGLQPGSSRI